MGAFCLIFIPMKLIALTVFTLFSQSIVSDPFTPLVRMEDHSLYFKKGICTNFLNDSLERLREVQLEYPQLVFQFTLFQLESESRNFALKRYKTVFKYFQELGLDMNRIVFESDAVYVKDFKNHLRSIPSTSLDSIGAILEGKVLSLD